MTDEDYSLGKHAWFVIVLIGNLLLLLLVVVVIIVIVVVVIMHCVLILPATEIEGRFMVSWEISISSLVIVVLIVIDPW